MADTEIDRWSDKEIYIYIIFIEDKIFLFYNSDLMQDLVGDIDRFIEK